MGKAYGLVLALGCFSFAAGLLTGIWLGFKVTTRDASILARLDQRVATALTKSAEAEARTVAIELEWGEQLAKLERKRASARAERQRAEQKIEQAAAAEGVTPEGVETPTPITGRERRRALGRGQRFTA